MSEWVTVCKEDELIIGSGVCALLGDRQVAIFRETRDGEVYALSNYDPIGEANILSRGILGSIGDKLVVASPLYKQHFCLKTGQCLEDENVCVQSYSARIENGTVQIKN